MLLPLLPGCCCIGCSCHADERRAWRAAAGLCAPGGGAAAAARVLLLLLVVAPVWFADTSCCCFCRYAAASAGVLVVVAAAQQLLLLLRVQLHSRMQALVWAQQLSRNGELCNKDRFDVGFFVGEPIR